MLLLILISFQRYALLSFRLNVLQILYSLSFSGKSKYLKITINRCSGTHKILKGLPFSLLIMPLNYYLTLIFLHFSRKFWIFF